VTTNRLNSVVCVLIVTYILASADCWVRFKSESIWLWSGLEWFEYSVHPYNEISSKLCALHQEWFKDLNTFLDVFKSFWTLLDLSYIFQVVIFVCD